MTADTSIKKNKFIYLGEADDDLLFQDIPMGSYGASSSP